MLLKLPRYLAAALAMLALSGANAAMATGVEDTPKSAPATVLRSAPATMQDLLPEPFDPMALVADFPQALPGMYAQRGGFDDFGDEDKDKVNVTQAMLFSLVLPGAGQWYAGNKNRAGVFFATEGVAWAALGYFKSVESIKRKDYEAYARANAGIDPEGKDDDFYRLISFYDSREEYNTAGRIIAPSRPYYPNITYWDWQWRSDAAREKYRTLRNQASEADNRARFSIGALVVNRLISAVDAWRTAKSVNRQARMELSEDWKVRMNGTPLGDNPRLKLTFSRRF